MEAMSQDQDEDLVPESNNNFNPDELTTPAVVVDQLKSIAETGTVEMDWVDLQRALKLRLENVLDHYEEKNRDCKEEKYQEPNVEKFNLENSRDEILELINSFSEAPFTIQRICELLYSPFKYYDRVSTFLRGLEKNLRVISSNNWPKYQPDTTRMDGISVNNQVATAHQEPQKQQQESQQQQEPQQQIHQQGPPQEVHQQAPPQQHIHQQESSETQDNIQPDHSIDEGGDIQAEVTSDIDLSKNTEQKVVNDQSITSNNEDVEANALIGSDNQKSIKDDEEERQEKESVQTLEEG